MPGRNAAWSRDKICHRIGRAWAKVQQGADAEGIEPQERCDRIAQEFKDVLTKLDISHDDYIRTTEQRHKKVVSELLQNLFDAGDIYQDEYEGFYSTRAEQFLQEKDKVDGEWPEIFGEVTRITEKNYFFKLSKYQDWLVEHIERTQGFIQPEFRKSQVLEFLKEPLNDLCISRPAERLSWGIPLPFDPGYVTYVWFDALVNYVTAAGYGTDNFAHLLASRCSCDWERYSCPSPCSVLANHAEGIQLAITQTDSCTWMVDDFWGKRCQKARARQLARWHWLSSMELMHFAFL